MESFIEKLNKLEEYIASSLLIVTSFLVFIQVILRYFFGYSLSWSEEIARMMIVWFIYLGSSIAVREKAHVSMDAVTSIVPPKVKKLLEIISTIVCIVFCVLIMRSGFSMALRAYAVESTSTAVKIPLFIPYAAVPVGLVFMMLRYIVQLKNSVLSFKVTPETKGPL